MSSDIVTTRMSTKPIVFERARSGWFFPEDKSVIHCIIHSPIFGGITKEERR